MRVFPHAFSNASELYSHVGGTQDEPLYQPHPLQTVELFALGIYGCLVTLVFCIVDKQ